MLEVNNISKSYRGSNALERVSFKCNYGSVIGLLGNNGAGKTTLMRVICGFVKPDYGDIKVNGLSINDDYASYMSKVGSCINASAGYKNNTAYDIVKYISELKNCYNHDKIVEFLDQMKINNNKRIKEFSLGMKVRLNLILALIGSPDIIIMDEPLNGLDPNGILEIKKLILKLAKEENKLIIVSSHILSEISQVADSVLILEKGKIVSKIDDISKNDKNLEELFFESVNE